MSGAERVVIVTFVPNESADDVRQALGAAGAGTIGEYTFCSFSAAGIGRFIPSEKANPTIGEKGHLTTVMEHRVEVVCERNKAKSIIAALRKAHPYEEVALYIYPLVAESAL